MSKKDACRKPEPGYEVGYRKPPRQHRFKSGQSGNPAGRKRKDASVTDELAKLYSETRTVMVNGEPEVIENLMLFARSEVKRALRGDMDAIANVLCQDQQGKLLAAVEAQGRPRGLIGLSEGPETEEDWEEFFAPLWAPERLKQLDDELWERLGGRPAKLSGRGGS